MSRVVTLKSSGYLTFIGPDVFDLDRDDLAFVDSIHKMLDAYEAVRDESTRQVALDRQEKGDG